MRNTEHTYLAIDLKSFYASVECVERGLDPLRVNLVVADESRTEKTICLAVSPALKQYGIPGRARLFEVVQKVEEANRLRRYHNGGKPLAGASSDRTELEKDPALAVSYVVAPPRMARYMEISTRIYAIYLRYIAPEDIHVYSIDEVFIDATHYLSTYHMTARELARKMIGDVLKETGITATAGIGTNLYLAKIAMDIVAKKMPADGNGVRIAELDELQYRKELWEHRPLTDFWRIGGGIARRLEQNHMHTMGDVARYSLVNEDLLYRLFGINAELLIDHAWGAESCTMQDIKAYRPRSGSISSGQVLSCPYDAAGGRRIAREMAEAMALDLVEKGLAADQIVLTVGYDIGSITAAYDGAVELDRYGRTVPKQAHGSIGLERYTSSSRRITEKTLELYDRIVDPALLVRRMYVVANHVIPERELPGEAVQMDLFTDPAAREKEESELEKEKRLQKAVLELQKQYGKNAVLKGHDFEEGATTILRNGQIGGHRA